MFHEELEEVQAPISREAVCLFQSTSPLFTEFPSLHSDLCKLLFPITLFELMCDSFCNADTLDSSEKLEGDQERWSEWGQEDLQQSWWGDMILTLDSTGATS